MMTKGVTIGLLCLLISSSANGKNVILETLGPVQEFGAVESVQLEDEINIFKEKCLHAHNEFRRLHVNTPDLVWDDTLQTAAQAFAEELAPVADDAMYHDSTNEANGWGENLFRKQSAREATCADAVLAWYNEIDNYDFATGASSNGGVIGHFTQVVWKTTLNVGVGIAVSTATIMPNVNKKYTIVAKYSPPGNYAGEYTDHVTSLTANAVRPTTPQALDSSICLTDGLPQNYCNYFQSSGQCETNPAVQDGCYSTCNICG